MKIRWEIRQNASSMSLISYVNEILIAYVSFNIPERIVWGIGAEHSKFVAEKISKRIKVNILY